MDDEGNVIKENKDENEKDIKHNVEDIEKLENATNELRLQCNEM
jgi:butyrate kinase